MKSFLALFLRKVEGNDGFGRGLPGKSADKVFQGIVSVSRARPNFVMRFGDRIRAAPGGSLRSPENNAIQQPNPLEIQLAD